MRTCGVLSVLCALILAGCAPDEAAPVAQEAPVPSASCQGGCAPAAAAPFAWAELAQGSSSQPGCAERHADRLMRTPQEWAAYWSEVHPHSPRPELPVVDFARESVLATCGWRPDPGHASAITQVEPPDPATNAVRVHVTDTQPGAGCAYPAVIGYGHHAVKVNRAVSAATFAHATAAAASCAAAPPPFAVETLDSGSYSGCAESGDWLIGTAQQWEAFWTRLHAGRNPPPARPAVDFARESVLATCMGTKPNGGYSTTIAQVTPDAAPGRVHVSVVDQEPGSSCATTQALTYPYYVVKVNRAALSSAAFTHTRQTGDC